MHSSLPGTVLEDRFLLREPIGIGGFSTVYRAHDQVLNRDVAIKIFATERLDTNFYRNLTKEARLATSVNHPNVIAVYSVGLFHQSQPYLAMELVKGKTLSDFVGVRGPLSLVDALEIVSGIADGVAALHAAGVLHRDIKPSNIVLFEEKTGKLKAKLIDLGLAKQIQTGTSTTTATGSTVGTPAFMSPEQIMGRKLDERSDIFALGLVLFYALTAQLPFNADDEPCAMMAPLADRPVSFAVAAPELLLPQALENICLRCLEKNAEDRFNSAGDLSRTIREVIHCLQSGAALPSIPRPPQRPLHGTQPATSTRPPVALVAALALAMLVFAGVSLVGTIRPLPPSSDQQFESADFKNPTELKSILARDAADHQLVDTQRCAIYKALAVHFKTRDTNAVRNYAEQALAIMPPNTPPNMKAELLDLYVNRSDYKSCPRLEEFLTREIRRNHGEDKIIRPYLQLQLGEYYVAQDRVAEGMSQLQSVAENPRLAPHVRSAACATLGEISFEHQRFDDACRYFHVATGPNSGIDATMRSHLFMRTFEAEADLKRWGEAEQDAKFIADPINAQLAEASLLVHQGKQSQAAKILSRLAKTPEKVICDAVLIQSVEHQIIGQPPSPLLDAVQKLKMKLAAQR